MSERAEPTSEEIEQVNRLTLQLADQHNEAPNLACLRQAVQTLFPGRSALDFVEIKLWRPDVPSEEIKR
jgi:hypothetical protein